MAERTRGISAKEAPSMVDQIRHRAHASVENSGTERVEFINTGSIILNLASSQRAKDGGWARGRIVNLVGDGSTGKTLLALEAAAQLHYYGEGRKSNLFPKVENIEIVYWNKEAQMDFPLEKMFGDSFVKAIDWSEKCVTAEQWGRDVFRRLRAHKPGCCFLGVLDSIDSLGTEAGRIRLDKSIKKDQPLADGEKEEKIKGSYGTGTERAKYFSADFFNNLCSEMKGKDFTLILISQVRDNINAGMFEKKQIRAGGKALDFYTHQVAWLASGERLKKEWDKQRRIYGVTIRARFDRSKVAPPFREAEVDILFDYGIDDVGSMAEFLSSDRIQKNFKDVFGGKQVSREILIESADNDEVMYDKLVVAVEEYWREIEANTKIVRRPRFGESRTKED